MNSICRRLLRRVSVIGGKPNAFAIIRVHSAISPGWLRLLSTVPNGSNPSRGEPRRRPTPTELPIKSDIDPEDALHLLKQVYQGEDMDLFFSALKAFASSNIKKNVNAEMFEFFRDQNGKIAAKVANSLNRQNIGTVIWALEKIHLKRTFPEDDKTMKAIGLQLLAMLCRMGNVHSRQLNTALLALAEMGVRWSDIPEADAVFINFSLWKTIVGLDATGVANVVTALSKFELKWSDLPAELQQALLLRVTHKSKNAYSNKDFMMNSVHFATVLYHMGKMGFKYGESHVRVQAVIEEMVCRTIQSVSEVPNILHQEQSLKTALIGLSMVGVEFEQLRPATKVKLASVVTLNLKIVSPFTFASIMDS